MMTMFYRHKNTKIILQYALFMNRKDFAPLYLDGIKKEIENINSRQLLLEALIVGFLNADFLDNRRQVCDSYFAILSRVLEGCPKSDWSGPNGLFFRLRTFICSLLNLHSSGEEVDLPVKVANGLRRAVEWLADSHNTDQQEDRSERLRDR